jgi:hypothetical protein
VEDELLAPRAVVADLAVKVALLPFGLDERLLLRQAGLHREAGLGQKTVER